MNKLMLKLMYYGINMTVRPSDYDKYIIRFEKQQDWPYKKSLEWMEYHVNCLEVDMWKADWECILEKYLDSFIEEFRDQN